MLQGCAGGAGVAVAVGLSLLLAAAAGGAACVWRWRHRGRPPLALPGFLRRRRGRGDYSQTLSAGRPGGGAKAPGPHPQDPQGPQDPQDHYENLPAGGRGPGLYENAGQAACEEHVYGNQASGDYYNFHAPGTPASPQDEDIYILPDAY
ncbi:protein GAPT [Pipistrellus kuhlii]|uniref:GRB2 binding adaptor protein, transmembrane n=1 Tax=Pipistrellus kuhlii TaxID=59472 RepID=A0A7J7YX41_PIPKU|nr:protein GAPT [Pipistrellus kuhlii]KAF6366226.1 GRB2 binding adaptor protein, transmembrane [Pipistrellus kuhlii]